MPFSIVRVPELETPLPVLPDMVLFLMLVVPLFDTPPESSAQSHPVKRQIPGRGGLREVAPHAYETESGCIPLAMNCGAVTFDSDPACNRRHDRMGTSELPKGVL